MFRSDKGIRYSILVDEGLEDVLQPFIEFIIGAMKLNAIFNSGQRLKDFVDMYSSLEKFTFHELLDACQKKYSDLNINMVKRSLIHFNNIILSPIEFIGPEIKWPAIAERLQKAFHNPYISFGLPESTKKPIQNRPSESKGIRKGPR